ncbi:hypothetical protein AVL48_14625 [Amycolatopsis regifaucium]|uniref:Uncharacterized protein n=1 Tax=Amycolatopsis regifaucium TaxID=546365 RepID=A0A154M5K3_9PSEU|nr:hypothetical protein AVL48_14625 [Amycolatopsis regifaucium]OKA10037.1 hypothetical protein ATP06_0206790 [Amycolatopsis regifaucium]
MLRAAWEGLVLIRWCGLEAATVGAAHASCQRSAESVEFDIAEQLYRSDALKHSGVVMPATGRDRRVAVVDEAAAVRAVDAIVTFATTSIAVLRPAAATAHSWPDKRACSTSIPLWRSLIDCWDGKNRSYRLLLPKVGPVWWPYF